MSDNRHPSRVSRIEFGRPRGRIGRTPTRPEIYNEMALTHHGRQLAPGSCYTADLKFIALTAGVQAVESVRVIDLATNETADIRDLPSIVAVEKGM